MDAREHYREAELLLRACAYDTKDAAVGGRDAERDADFLRAAHVHALLAIAHGHLPVDVSLAIGGSPDGDR